MVQLKENGQPIGTQRLLHNAQADRTKYPFLVYCTFNYSGRPYPTKGELDSFRAFDDQFEGAKEELQEVACISARGKRVYIIYASEPQVEQWLREAAKPLHPEIKVERDEGWSQYEALLEAFETLAK